MWIIIAEVVISWLTIFGVINLRNPQARKLVEIISRLTFPVLNKIRQFIPPIAGLDLSPLVVIFAITIIQNIIISSV